MTTKNENQSQNQLQDKIKNEVSIIEALINFHTALKDINSSLDQILAQMHLNAI